MMNPGDTYGHVHPAHHPMPMDLHVPQGFYYRYRNEAFSCWPESGRKPGVDEVVGVQQGSMNARQSFEAQRYPPTAQTMPILELRKEKSRDAARSRRGKENYEFYELAKMLPLPAAITSQLDKASIIRLTISYLRLKDFSSHGDPPWSKENQQQNKKARPRSTGNVTIDLFEQHIGTHILQSLDGFAFSLAADGRFLYISETVSIYLGLSQVEMTGSSVFDYIHQQDHAELAEQLGLGLSTGSGASVPSPGGSDDGSSSSATNNPDVSSLMSISSNSNYKGMDRAFCIRMKSTLTKRGCHFKSSGYRVVLVLCRLRPQYSFSHSRKSPPPLLGMVALAIALPPPSVHEIRLESDMFVTRVTFDFKIIHCEPRVSELLDYTADELMGKNLYSLCYGEDVNKLRKCHVDLLNKGQVMSQYYRIMNKNGGYSWLQTCATVVCNSKNSDEQSIICVNYIMSNPELTNLVMDCCQLDQEILPQVKREPISVEDRDRKSPDDRDSTDGSGRGRESKGGHLDAHRSPDGGHARSTVEKSTERRNLQQSTRNSRITTADETNPTILPESQPLTPISSTSATSAEHIALTPQSVRSDPDIIPPTVTPTTAAVQAKAPRKRKIKNQPASSNSPAHLTESCAKRQIIVQNNNEVSSLVVNGGDGETSPNDPEDSARSWRKANNHQIWEANGGSSSVKDLEQVMSKHLPGRDHNDHAHVTSDFSTDSLLRSSQPSSNSSSSNRTAIQWAGGAPPGSAGAGGQVVGNGSGLPVSALLRQLCASRESVIRANVAAAAAWTVQSALPTPPGSDGYMGGSQESQFMGSQQGKSNGQDFSLYPNVTSYDYQAAMTPPASVSPRDKPTYGSVVNGHGPSDSSHLINSNYGDPHSFRPPHHGTYLDGPAQPLPLKPQVYGYSSIDHQYPNHHHLSAVDHTQSQFYPPPHHTGFHLYHPTAKPSPYGDLKNSNWYSATS